MNNVRSQHSYQTETADFAVFVDLVSRFVVAIGSLHEDELQAKVLFSCYYVSFETTSFHVTKNMKNNSSLLRSKRSNHHKIDLENATPFKNIKKFERN